LSANALAPPAPRALPLRARRALELLAAGGLTLLLFPLAYVARRTFGLDSAEYAFGFTTFWLAYVVNDPHFAVTYFLFYRDARRRALAPAMPRAQRARWWIAGALVPAAIVLGSAFALLTRSAQGIGALVQLMYLLVGWHYAKQGFGALAVLSARRGARFTPFERRALLAHAYVGWAFAWANPATPAGDFEERGVIYRALARPHVLELAAGAALGASTIVLAWALVAKWRRDPRAFPLGPVVVFLVTLWAWTIGSAWDPLLRYAIPALHSIQYAYFVGLLEGNAARVDEGPPRFGPPAWTRVATLFASAVALGWLLFHGAPGVLDAALVKHGRHGEALDALGATPFAAVFYVAVNLHHFAMDAVIWRREEPRTRFLVSTS
jgi:hypothetical protein